MLRTLCVACLALSGLLDLSMVLAADDAELLPQAEAALRRAADFFHSRVSCRGGYLWRYSADLQKREGEGRAEASTVWVQPPGTPAVGAALLDAYLLTGEDCYLAMAIETGRCLVSGQLRSGGWDYRIETEPARRTRYAYRIDPSNDKAKNTTTLDDDTTQTALRFLMRLDQTLGFKDTSIHEAAGYALQALLKSQYPNGAWPQRFSVPPAPAEFPVLRASYPDSWLRQWPAAKYTDYYTFNDNTMADVIDVMLLANRIYSDDDCRQAAIRCADFFLLAQMPEPQPGWAQQYDRQMHPAWARKFEPPAITGSESAGIVKSLLRMYAETGHSKYLQSAGKALEYYRGQRLSEGGLARFYELKTNRPLYFTRDYQLTYDDSDLPTHYAFKVGNWTESVARQYRSLASKPWKPLQLKPSPTRPRLTESLAAKARKTIAAQDPRGVWIESGRLKYHGDNDETQQIIDCRTFIKNVQALAEYIAAARAANP